MKTLRLSTRSTSIPGVLLAVLVLIAGCGSNEPATPPASEERALPTGTANNNRNVLYWRAPMDPTEIYDRPGKSRMGMDLVPVYEDEAAASTPGTVAIDPTTMQNIGVRTAPVTIEPLGRTIRTTGRFQMDEQGIYTVSLKVRGWVETLHVDYEGAIVQQGQRLLDLYSPELVSAQEEYLLALRNVRRLGGSPASEDARRLLEAAHRRLTYWDLTEDQVRTLEETGAPQRTLTFYAPASGEVMNKKVVAGQQVMAGEALMDLVDISKIWLIADVYEQDLGWIKKGTPARIELPYQPDQVFTGQVDYIYHMLNSELRTARARIILPGRHGGPFKPGMYATVYLESEKTDPMPVVPEEALIRTGEQALVILALGQGRFQPREVQVGFQAEGKIQILHGLQGHEQVVTSGQFLIDSEARLKSAVGAMLGNPEEDAMPGHDHGTP